MANDILVKISADAKQFNDEIDKVKKKTEDLEDILGGVAKASSLVFAGLVGSAALAIKAFGDAEKSTVELTAALENQGLAAKENVKSYRQYADAVSKSTGIDDDAIVAAQAKLQTYIGQTKITGELTKAIVDLSTQTGSLDSAAEQLGLAFQGNTRSFDRQKISIDQNATAEERLQQAVDGVNTRYGDYAAAIGNASGSTAKLRVAVGNLIENIGGKLAPIFDAAVKAVTKFVVALSENDALLSYVVDFGKVLLVVSGAVSVFATAGLAILKIKQVLEITSIALKFFGIAAKTATLSTGIGALLLILPLIIENFGLIKSVVIGTLRTLAEGLLGFGRIVEGLITRDFGKVKDGIDEIKGSVAAGIKVGKVEFAKSSGDGGVGEVTAQEEAKLEAKRSSAKKEAEERKRRDELNKAQTQNSVDIALLQAKQGSEEVIKLKQQENEILKQLEDEKNKDIRAALEERLATTRLLEQEAAANAAADKKIFADQILADNETYNQLEADQKATFLAQNQQALLAQVQNERDVKNKALLDQLTAQIAANNQFILERQKFGAAYATINKQLNSEEVKGAQGAANELVGLAQSKNSTLKSIGKAAAVAQITIDTARGAMAVYANFQSAIPFPPVSIPLGIAAAAAVVAYGAERIGNVVAAAEGGVVPGFNRGGDSVNAILQPGELVVPRQNFSQVIQAVAAKQAEVDAAEQAGTTVPNPASPGTQMIAIGFDGGEAEKVITARRVEARSLGTLREARA